MAWRRLVARLADRLVFSIYEPNSPVPSPTAGMVNPGCAELYNGSDGIVAAAADSSEAATSASRAMVWLKMREYLTRATARAMELSADS